MGCASIRESRIGSVCGEVRLVLLGKTLWTISCLDFRIYFLIGRSKISQVRVILGERVLSLPVIVQTCKIFVRLNGLVLQKPGNNTLCVQPRNCLKNCSQLPVQAVKHSIRIQNGLLLLYETSLTGQIWVVTRWEKYSLKSSNKI